MIRTPRTWILLIIVLAQFCCTSLWFAGNAIILDLIDDFNLNNTALGHLTSAVQFGFILGTLIFAIFSLADRFSASKVFFISAVLAAGFNGLISFGTQTLGSLVVYRFLTGFFLAGIYPVGMKIAADYFKEGLGQSLGFLVGALVLGTALPHLIKANNTSMSWLFVVYLTSSLSVLGGIIILVFVPDGPYKSALKKFNMREAFKVFKDKQFRAAAFGYFGHMWELYAFWTFVPILLTRYKEVHTQSGLNVSLVTFFVIAVGGLGCVLSGYLSSRFSVHKIAYVALLVSGSCCLCLPLVYALDSAVILLIFLLFWGIAVIADSPMFSTLVAQNVRQELKGTGLTLVNCIGFALTILSIQLVAILQQYYSIEWALLILVVGPILGSVALKNIS